MFNNDLIFDCLLQVIYTHGDVCCNSVDKDIEFFLEDLSILFNYPNSAGERDADKWPINGYKSLNNVANYKDVAFN